VEQVANIVNQRIVPELKDQIVQAIEALQKIPSSSSTLYTEQHLSGSQGSR
jgi:predicted choloylglycine hydrolase